MKQQITLRLRDNLNKVDLKELDPRAVKFTATYYKRSD